MSALDWEGATRAKRAHHPGRKVLTRGEEQRKLWLAAYWRRKDKWVYANAQHASRMGRCGSSRKKVTLPHVSILSCTL